MVVAVKFALALTATALLGLSLVLALALFSAEGGEVNAPHKAAGKRWFYADTQTISGAPFSLVCTRHVSRPAFAEPTSQKLRPGDMIKTVCTAVESTGGGS